MSRKLINVVVVVGAIGLGVGSTIAWSNIARPVGGTADVTKVDLGQSSTDAIAPSHPEWTPAIMTRVDFDRTFADLAAVPRRENTPANRERLREAGWKRIIGSR
jgi:hypothetical protein